MTLMPDWEPPRTRQAWWPLAIVTLIGGALRIWSPARIGLWRDEIQAINLASLSSVGAILQFLYAHESHPPLYYLLLHAVAVLSGGEVQAASAIALTASIALIPVGWWLGSETRVSGGGLASAAIIALSFPLCLFGVQSRPYSLVSLLLLASMAALLRAFRSGAYRWKYLWTILVIALVYIHHLGVLLVVVELCTILFLFGTLHVRHTVRLTWMGPIALVVIGTLPDIWLLLHQGAQSGYRAAQPMTLTQPLIQFLQLGLRLPLEVSFATSGCIAILAALRRREPACIDSAIARTRAAAIALAGMLAFILLIVASYRSAFLAIHIVLAVAPLPMVGAAVFVARLIAETRRIAGTLWIEGAVVGLTCGFLFAIGFSKTNTDLVAGYLDAEARPNDFLMLTPGAAGASLNHYLTQQMSQMDFPYLGAISLYPFDHDFDRIAALPTLTAAIDSIEAVCSAGRRLWYVTPWFSDHGRKAPIVLQSDSFGGLGQADVARALLLRRIIAARFGPPIRTTLPDSSSKGMELLSVELFTRSALRENNVSICRCCESL